MGYYMKLVNRSIFTAIGLLLLAYGTHSSKPPAKCKSSRYTVDLVTTSVSSMGTCRYDGTSKEMWPMVPSWTQFLILNNNNLTNNLLQLNQLQTLSNFNYFQAKYNRLTALPIVSHVKSIDISYNLVTSVDLSSLSALSNLEYLILKDNTITSLSLSSNMTTLSLKVILLENNQLKYLDLSVFQSTQNLTHLYLQRNPIASMSGYVNSSKALYYTNLEYHNMTTFNLAPFDSVASHTLYARYGEATNVICTDDCTLNNVYSITMKNQKITTLDLSAIIKTSKLRYMYFAYNSITDIIGLNGSVPARSDREIDIQQNSLTALDFSVFHYTGVYYLNVNDNSITQLQGPAGSLSYVREINLVSNKLSMINLSIFENMPELKFLKISSNLIESLVGISGPAKLRTLHLNDNKLLEVDFSLFSHCTKLNTLYLRDNNIHTIIPSTVSINLRNIYLSNNKLTQLNLSTFQNLPLLNQLELTNNMISSILDNHELISFDGISLDVSSNPLMELNFTAFSNVTGISTLTFISCPIETLIEATSEISNVTVLKIESGNLKYIDFYMFVKFVSLSELSLEGNKIINLTESNENILELVTLNLKSNQLTDINFSMFSKMPKLRNIDFSSNDINHFSKSASELRLQIINFYQNKFTSFNTTNLSKMPVLQSVDLRYNQLKMIGPSYCKSRFNRISGGFKMYLDDNPLHCVEDLRWIKECNYVIDFSYTSSRTKCSSPKRIANQYIDNLSANQFESDECESNPCQHSGSCSDYPGNYTCTCQDGYNGTNCETEIIECESNPCINGGQCEDAVNSYSCLCAGGYTDTNCQTDINECISNPCLYNGTCTDKVNGYICVCMQGYNGSRCETDIDECVSDPCDNNGTCSDMVNGYTCTCPAGFTGNICETNINECNSNPCQFNGTCSDKINGYTCKCQNGYTGMICETDINECSSNPCQNGGTCSDAVNSYYCTCKSGFTSSQCEININECSSDPCANNARCNDAIDSYNCLCQAGYTGLHCQTDIDECISNPCLYNGTCTDNLNGYLCICMQGYNGSRCETDINECVSDPCDNNGTCFDVVNGYICTCPAGFTGSDCEIDINECNSNPCQFNGTCSDKVNGYTCTCQSGYTGMVCDTDINECSSNPCQNDGTCFDAVNSYYCTCKSGFTGSHCEINFNECSSDPCANNATCNDAIDSYNCSCQPGYTGLRCQTDINECASNPCVNGGTCSDGINGYICACPLGFTEAQCQTDIDECSSGPCQHQGNCHDFVNGYTCICGAGYTGVICQTDIDECVSMPCAHNGTCSDNVNGYTCTCQVGIIGIHCETNINECSSNPCQNHGTCIDDINGYTCDCVPGYIHDHCQTEEVWKTMERATDRLRNLNLNSSADGNFLQSTIGLLSQLQNITDILTTIYNPNVEQQQVMKDVMNLASNFLGKTFNFIGYSTSQPLNTSNVNMTEIKQIVNQTLSIVYQLSDTLLTAVSVGDPHVTLDITPLTIAYSKMTPTQIVNYTQSSQYGNVKFSGVNSSKTDCLTVVLLFSEVNPFMWNSTAENVSSSTVSVRATPCSENNRTSENRKKRDVGGNTNGKEPTGISFQSELTVHQQPDSFKVNVSVNSSVQHFMTLQSNNKPVCLSISPAENQSLNVYIGFKPDTNKYNHHSQYIIMWDPDKKDDNFLYDGIVSYNGNETLCISGETLQEKDAKAVYFVVTTKESNCDTNITQCSPQFMQYTYSMLQLECQVWDDQEEIWSDKHCQVEPESTPKKIRFKSNLMASLGAGLFVAPNTINFLTVFDNLGQKLIDNAAVIGTLATLLVIYAIAAFFCRRLDNNDKIRWAVLPLPDNFPDDEHKYELHVYTGFKRNSGTTSNVNIVLAGTEIDTGVRELTAVGRKNFQTGEVNSFLLTTSLSIGEPNCIKIWHDGTGEGNKKTWFLSKIVLIDLSSHKWYVFHNDKWLSGEEGSFKLLQIARYLTEGSQFINNVSHSFYNYHIWLSVAYRKVSSAFNRVQRLNCCLTTFFLLIVCSAMWFGTGDSSPPKVAFTLGAISITVHQVYTSTMTMIMSLPIILFIIMFYDNIEQKSPILYGHYNKQKTMWKDKGIRRRKLPHWCVYIAHATVALTVIVCTFFTILYAFEWGKQKSEEWLGTLCICIIESLLFISPFMVIAMALLYSFILKADSSLVDYESLLGKMQLRTNNSIKLAGQDSQLDMMERIEKTKLKEQRLHKETMKIFREIFWQVLLLLVVIAIINANQDGNVYKQNQDLKYVFLKDINEVTRVLETWDWMLDVLLPNLYWTNHYNGDTITSYDKKFIANGYAMRFGPPIIRQVRVKQESCDILSELQDYLNICIKEYTLNDEDTNNYLPEWKKKIVLTDNISDTDTWDIKSAFMYQNDPKGTFYWGAAYYYAPGGYFMNLGMSYQKALDMLIKLRNNMWIDKYTKAIIVKFSVWNANTNLFNEFLVTFEYISPGLIQNSVSINSIQLYRYVGAKGLWNLILEIVATIFMLVKAILEIIKLIKQKTRYFHHLENIMTLICISLFNIALAAYVWRSLLTVETVEFMMNNRGEIVNFQLLTLANELFLTFLGFCAFFAQLLLLHILRHVTIISVLGKTLKKSSKTLLNACLTTTIASLAFIFLLCKMYGSSTNDYRSLLSTSNTLILGTLGKFRFDRLVEGSGEFGFMMFITYLILQSCIFLNMMCTILIDFMVLIDEGRTVKDQEVIEYLKKWVKQLIIPSNDSSGTETLDVNNDDKTCRRLNDRVDTLITVLDLQAEFTDSDVLTTDLSLCMLLNSTKL